MTGARIRATEPEPQKVHGLAFTWSRGNGVHDTFPTNHGADDFAAFAAFILSDLQRGKGPGWFAGAFDPPQRASVNALPRRWIGLDLDGGLGSEDFAMLCGVVQRWNGLIYTTASSTRAAPRARIILELDQSAARDDLMKASAAMRSRIDEEMTALGCLRPQWDSQCDRPEQPLFLPPDAAWSARYEGEPVALLPLLSSPPAPATRAHPRDLVARPMAPELLTPRTVGDLSAALAFLPADDYGTWIRVGHALAPSGEQGKALWLEWSKTSEKWKDTDADRWASFANSRSSYRAVFTHAQAAGWVNPMAKPPGEPAIGAADSNRSLGSLRDMLRRFTPAALRTKPEPRRYVWEPLLPAGKVAILTGAGGTSKTGIMVRAMVGIALGEPVFGLATTCAKCLYVTAEDTAEDLHRHLFECTHQLPDSHAERVAEGVIILDAAGRGLKLTRLDAGNACTTAKATELAGLVAELGVGFVVLDTASRLNAAGETNEGMAALVEAAEEVAARSGACIVILHHVGKGQLREGIVDQYAGRGGSSLSDNSRSALHLAVVTNPNEAPVPDAPALVTQGALLALHHVKANGRRLPDPIFIHRLQGEHAAVLVHLPPIARSDPNEATWRELSAWIAANRESVPYPTRQTLDTLTDIGTRQTRRLALQWALDRGKVVDLTHPSPRGRSKTYLALSDQLDASERDYRAAAKGGPPPFNPPNRSAD